MDDTITCGWFLNCRNETTDGYDHPILGVVAICKRCHGNMGITPTHVLEAVK